MNDSRTRATSRMPSRCRWPPTHRPTTGSAHWRCMSAHLHVSRARRTATCSRRGEQVDCEVSAQSSEDAAPRCWLRAVVSQRAAAMGRRSTVVGVRGRTLAATLYRAIRCVWRLTIGSRRRLRIDRELPAQSSEDAAQRCWIRVGAQRLGAAMARRSIDVGTRQWTLAATLCRAIRCVWRFAFH